MNPNQDTIEMSPLAPAAVDSHCCKNMPADADYYSVEFGLNDTHPVYQFKLWHSERTPHFFLLKQSSELAAQLKVGEIISMKFYCSDPRRNIEQHKTRINAMVKENILNASVGMNPHALPWDFDRLILVISGPERGFRARKGFVFSIPCN